VDVSTRPPGGPRGAIGAQAEDAAAAHLRGLGWVILGRNLRVGGQEVDILALEPGQPPTLVVMEVRSRSGPGFGSALESVGPDKVRRLYTAALSSIRDGPTLGAPAAASAAAAAAAAGAAGRYRVDLLALRRRGGTWRIETHVRGLTPG
jgi:putative endonuclease